MYVILCIKTPSMPWQQNGDAHPTAMIVVVAVAVAVASLVRLAWMNTMLLSRLKPLAVEMVSK